MSDSYNDSFHCRCMSFLATADEMILEKWHASMLDNVVDLPGFEEPVALNNSRLNIKPRYQLSYTGDLKEPVPARLLSRFWYLIWCEILYKSRQWYY